MNRSALFITISLFLVGQMFAQGETTVSGTVTDAATGDALVGANVVVEGTDLGDAADANGNYSIVNVPAGATITASMIGYTGANATAAATVNFALSSEAIAVEDIVVIGYGTQSRRDVTGAISSLKEGSFTKGATTDLQSLLQARVPGVVVTANNGDIGSEPRIRIRGGTSINASNNPIIVIDGVPIDNSSALPTGFTTGAGAGADGTRDNPLGMLNPGDIASIDILKDASSSAIYGARGGNGVILITTKQGRPGEVSVSYNAYTSTSEVSKKLDLMSASEYKSYASDIGASIEDGGANTDWQDEIYRTALSQSH
ncbi:MAG TPA: SusC/RagA family TonB-linked outer membrane protein, partial [Flavobacteriales bacterium]|nr:SusC/RagA family TonB-linked outer membrane protein [Flavobacteriales bacterium]